MPQRHLASMPALPAPAAQLSIDLRFAPRCLLLLPAASLPFNAIAHTALTPFGVAGKAFGPQRGMAQRALQRCNTQGPAAPAALQCLTLAWKQHVTCRPQTFCCLTTCTACMNSAITPLPPPHKASTFRSPQRALSLCGPMPHRRSPLRSCRLAPASTQCGCWAAHFLVKASNVLRGAATRAVQY